MMHGVAAGVPQLIAAIFGRLARHRRLESRGVESAEQGESVEFLDGVEVGEILQAVDLGGGDAEFGLQRFVQRLPGRGQGALAAHQGQQRVQLRRIPEAGEIRIDGDVRPGGNQRIGAVFRGNIAAAGVAVPSVSVAIPVIAAASCQRQHQRQRQAQQQQRRPGRPPPHPARSSHFAHLPANSGRPGFRRSAAVRGFQRYRRIQHNTPPPGRYTGIPGGYRRQIPAHRAMDNTPRRPKGIAVDRYRQAAYTLYHDGI